MAENESGNEAKNERAAPARILTIAGSDSSGGAGIQADIKTITMLSGYAMTAITANTAQNSVGVQAIVPMTGDFVGQQIRSCIEDIGVDAVKIGMLHDEDIIAAVVTEIDKLADNIPIILDPVMLSTSGSTLITKPAIAMMREMLFPLASMITPNLPELELLSDSKPTTTKEMDEAATALAQTYDCHVLAKGGHTDDERIVDVLVGGGNRAVAFNNARIDTPHTHGTGCTLSSAIATMMGHGQSAEHAVRLSRRFVYQSILNAPGFGKGNGPLGHHAVRSLR